MHLRLRLSQLTAFWALLTVLTAVFLLTTRNLHWSAPQATAHAQLAPSQLSSLAVPVAPVTDCLPWICPATHTDVVGLPKSIACSSGSRKETPGRPKMAPRTVAVQLVLLGHGAGLQPSPPSPPSSSEGGAPAKDEDLYHAS